MTWKPWPWGSITWKKLSLKLPLNCYEEPLNLRYRSKHKWNIQKAKVRSTYFLPRSDDTCWSKNLQTQLLGNILKGSKLLAPSGVEAQHDQPLAGDLMRFEEQHRGVDWLIFNFCSTSEILWFLWTLKDALIPHWCQSNFRVNSFLRFSCTVPIKRHVFF